MTYIINWVEEERKIDKAIFMLSKIRERKSRDYDHVGYIKTNDQKVLVKDNDIIEGGENIIMNF